MRLFRENTICRCSVEQPRLHSISRKPCDVHLSGWVREKVATACLLMTLFLLPTLLSVAAAGKDISATAGREGTKNTGPEQEPGETIPWSELSRKASEQYRGDGLSMIRSEQGATLRCAFQELEGEVTAEGLWLKSTAPGSGQHRFRVVASAIGREYQSSIATDACRLSQGNGLVSTGIVQVGNPLVRFIRPGVIEEYSVSVDGVRQDFIIEHPIAQHSAINQHESELRVELDISGARVERTARGTRLALEGSERKIAYSQLHVEDACGRVLDARLEVVAADRMAVLVNDIDAVYPLRIDPTFSDENWIGMGGIPGANGAVYAIATDESGNVYVGGNFTLIGDVLANRVAKWDGSQWSALGSGMNDQVRALAVSGGELYAGGGFTTAGGNAANRIAKWNGTNWSPLGSGMNNWVYALAATDTNLYAGGDFITAGGNRANYIAKWDGSTWSEVGLGMDYFVRALSISGTNLYVGGYFFSATNVGGASITVNRVARWDGNTWSALGLGMNSTVLALTVSGTNLYAGGAFTVADGSPANFIAKWNGTSWSAVPGLSFTVSALTVLGEDLYAGGLFAGGNAIKYVAKWNGSNWSGLGVGLNNTVWALGVSDGKLYVGGDYTTATNTDNTLVAVNNIGNWNTNGWSAVGWSGSGSGLGTTAYGLMTSGSNLYAGGSFRTAGDQVVNFVGKWDGNRWSALGPGVNSSVLSLLPWGGDLYIGGVFTVAGSNLANRIARWDGTNWSPLGLGLNERVRALAASVTDLFAGGDFTTAGGNAAPYIAKWNGNTWSALGMGLSTNAYALAVSGNDLYVGGDFIRATNMSGTAVPVNRIAKWNGASWSPLGLGVNSTVYALAVSGNDLYVAGDFTRATNTGGASVSVNRIAKWNGTTWSALGSGMNGTVLALAVSANDVFAGGSFTTAAGGPASRIAKWNGSAWSALGSGLNNNARSLTLLDRNLYAAGNFTAAGGKVSASVAQAVLILPANAIPPLFLDGADFVTRFDGTPGISYTIEFATTVPPTNWQKATNLTAPSTNEGLGIGVFEFRDNSTAAPQRFYRSVYPPY